MMKNMSKTKWITLLTTLSVLLLLGALMASPAFAKKPASPHEKYVVCHYQDVQEWDFGGPGSEDDVLLADIGWDVSNPDLAALAKHIGGEGLNGKMYDPHTDDTYDDMLLSESFTAADCLERNG